MKKGVLILALLFLLLACAEEQVKKVSTQEGKPLLISDPLPRKEVDLYRGLPFGSPELKSYAEELRNQDAVWFNKASTKDILFTIKKGNEFTQEQSGRICKDTCNVCSQKLGKNLVEAQFKPDEVKADVCTCKLSEEVNGGEYYSCMEEANMNIFSELFDGLLKREPLAFPKLNQMKFTFSNYQAEKLSKDFCDNVCNYCATKFSQDLEFISSSISEEGLKCTCQTMDPYGVNLYRINACLSDLVNIFPHK